MLFIVAAVAIVANTIVAEPRRTVFGIFIMLVGIPAFVLWSSHKGQRATPESRSTVAIASSHASQALSEDINCTRTAHRLPYKD